MAEKNVISMTNIVAFFKENISQLQRGEIYYDSGNVVQVVFYSEVQPALLKGEVKSSMTNRCYSIEVYLDDQDGIVDASCSCPRNQAICHHIAAVCIYGYHDITVTSETCTGSAPKVQADEKILTIEDLYPKKRKDYCAVNRLLTEAEINEFVEKLGPNTGFSWLLKPEPTDN